MRLVDLMEEKRLCCLCGEVIEGFGNNPAPLMMSEDERCCDACDDMFVIPARLWTLEYTREYKKHPPTEQYANAYNAIRQAHGIRG